MQSQTKEIVHTDSNLGLNCEPRRQDAFLGVIFALMQEVASKA